MSVRKLVRKLGKCTVCREEFIQPDVGRRRKYCSNACSQKAYRIRHPVRHRSYQRIIREFEAEINPHEPIESLDGCYVERIASKEAKVLILKYEWLGSMPGRIAACYGLRSPEGELLGVTVFGWGMPSAGSSICGDENKDKAFCLERGACVHWAPPNSASFLISHACRLAAEELGARIIFAYADSSAGELGTVYQSCNWLYVGKSETLISVWRLPDGTVRHKNGWIVEDPIAAGWVREYREPKMKYVHFEGDRREKKALLAALKLPVLPYPS